MAEARRKVNQSPKRVFINDVNLYASKYIAKLLSECVLGALGDDEEEEEEEEEVMSEQSRAAAFQVVGTVSEQLNEDRKYVLEDYFHPDREQLLGKLMECDVVIYNISQHAEQVEEAFWAVTALHKEIDNFSGPKMFILVSTVMTWACSKPVDPDNLEFPFTDEMFWSRRAHPNFRKHIDLEKKVVKMGKTDRAKFCTYVVASGLQYGMGEQVFHYFYKKSWLGQDDEIPVFGEGKNIIPTIHINDLARVVQNVIRHQPRPYYLLAVDSSNNTMEEIVKSVSSTLGPGQIQNKPFEEAFLIKDSSVMEIDSWGVNLCMEAVFIRNLFSINWLCESGLVTNIELVVEEYRQTRGLLPIRLCVLGPPAVGKSTISKQLCEHYKLHHITLKDTISETIGLLENVVKIADISADADADSIAEAQELLNSLKSSTAENEDLSENHLKVMKNKLKSNPCRNQGFVLDDFPESYEQAKELFGDEEHDGASHNSSYNMSLNPEFVLCLDASDSFLTERAINLPEGQAPENFSERLARYRKSKREEEVVVHYFVEQDIMPLCLEITSSDEPDSSLLMRKVLNIVGQPRNYGPSIQEVEEEERRKTEERMRREAQERAEEEQREAEEARFRAARWEEWTERLEKERKREEEELEAQSAPMRAYLMEHFMPTLVQGLTECCRAKPQDPVDFLAEYLIKNSPLDYSD
ncbi:adenylate kinase 7 [Parambassis ranga]|uniref:Adenylate kinase 7 n=1 Tax=Parambassis ranga TaxID=210632 RepID=A0A6P7HFE1_9TELE|nr:adenylate kinase 7 [Parambassis ranga]